MFDLPNSLSGPCIVVLEIDNVTIQAPVDFTTIIITEPLTVSKSGLAHAPTTLLLISTLPASTPTTSTLIASASDKIYLNSTDLTETSKTLTAQVLLGEESKRRERNRIVIGVASAGGGSLIIVVGFFVARCCWKKHKARKAIRTTLQEEMQMSRILADRDRGTFDGSGKSATSRKRH